jgi:hypothetical protein
MAEDFTLNFTGHITHTHKLHRRITKHLQEIGDIHSEMGGIYNTWSLSESPLVSSLIEKTGEAYDALSVCHGRVNRIMEHDITETLKQYVLYGSVVDQLLKWRNRRQVEAENIETSIDQKKLKIAKLELAENEANRLNAVIDYESSSTVRQAAGIMGKINSLIDKDPEQTRRNNLVKLKEQLIDLEKTIVQKQQDVQLANVEIQADLDRFQIQKIRDFKQFWIDYARFMKLYHAKCKEIWSSV